MDVLSNNIEDFLGNQIDFLNSIFVKDNNKKLKRKKKKFFIECVKLSMAGIDFNDISSTEYLRDYMGFKSSDTVYTYKCQLKSMGWMGKSSKKYRTFKLHPSFDFYNKKLNPEVSYTYSIRCKKEAFEALIENFKNIDYNFSFK